MIAEHIAAADRGEIPPGVWNIAMRLYRRRVQLMRDGGMQGAVDVWPAAEAYRPGDNAEVDIAVCQAKAVYGE